MPRNAEGVALIGDPRNDVHIPVSQLHVAMIKVHNRLVELARERGIADGEVFEAARRETIWHYQWVIVNDYLPRLVGAELVDSILEEGARFYRPDMPRIPFEFADAAFRYGHSQVRDSFELNPHSGELRLFPDLLGFRPVPAERVIEWSRLFDVKGARPAQRAKLIDGRLARANRASGGDHGRGQARCLPLARRPRPRARKRVWPALGRGRGESDGRGPAHRRSSPTPALRSPPSGRRQ